MKAERSVYRRTTRLVVGIGILLMIPLVAMQFTNEVTWSPGDFVVAGGLLLGTGLMYELVASKSVSVAYRAGVALALLASLMLVWVALAVGIIGVEGDPADLMYLGVLAVGVIGAFMARFQPEGMARTLVAMAVVQALVAAIALGLGKYKVYHGPVSEVLGPNACFIALFLASAWLFRKAARHRVQ